MRVPWGFLNSWIRRCCTPSIVSFLCLKASLLALLERWTAVVMSWPHFLQSSEPKKEDKKYEYYATTTLSSDNFFDWDYWQASKFCINYLAFKFADKYLKGEFTTTWKTQSSKLQFQGKTKYHWENLSMAHVFTIETIWHLFVPCSYNKLIYNKQVKSAISAHWLTSS